VIVAFSADPPPKLLALVRELKKLEVQVDIVPRLFEVVGPHVDVHSVEGIPLIALPTVKHFPASRMIKRAVDIVGASIALVLSAPLFGFFAWRIRRDSPGPILFRQTRLGEGMQGFTALKFRTMRTDVDNSVHREYIKNTMSASATVGENGLYKLDRSDAVTPFGRWLRKTSLDELPQLINVVRGEMSLVGPRPCLPYETEFFAPEHFERFAVPAGITGLWQVTARAYATFGEALDMDVAYARNWSLGLDLRLILRTPLHLLRRKGTT
jgi:lipopolysaccharide/colanic/teichoic acid biosynthesis glycosyltransferase